MTASPHRDCSRSSLQRSKSGISSPDTDEAWNPHQIFEVRSKLLDLRRPDLIAKELPEG